MLSAEEFAEFKQHIYDKIDNMPNKILETEIELKNGDKKIMTFREAVIGNYKNINKIKERLDNGDINVLVKDEYGMFPRPLNKVIEKLTDRPKMFFDKLSDNSKRIVTIFKAFLIIGGIFTAIFMIMKALYGN